MIRFCYSPDGNYNLQTLPDRIESFVIDKKNQKLRVFDTEDFYFSVLDSNYIDSSDPSVGLSMLGANRLYNEFVLLDQEFDKLNSSFNILNNNVSTYKNSVTSLQEDYRSYKIQINTDFTNFKNNVNAENSSFREKFESYWVECERVVSAAMNDLNLQIQTIDSSVNLAISDCKSDISVYKKEFDKLNDNFNILNNNVSTVISDCKSDISVYKKEFDKLNDNFNILNNNVSTYKNSVTSLQEDYRSYKTQIETAFTNFKNNVNAENSSFRNKFESYWVECERVVTAAMDDLSLQVQTLDSSVNLAISDILSRLDAIENKS